MNTLSVYDKYSGDLLSTLPLHNEADLDTIIRRAKSAQKGFKAYSAGKKAQLLHRLTELIERDKEIFISLLISEAGKPRSYAGAEVERGIFTVRSAAEEAVRFGGEYIPLDFGAGEGKTALTKAFPLGIILGITPFNFPLNLALHKIAPAFATGNAIIIKPSPYAPLCMVHLKNLVEEAGYPEGIFQLLICDNEVSEKAVRSDEIAMLSFTGSPKVGWYLKNIAGKKKVCLELGGNAAVLVDETADLDPAALQTATGSNAYSGQTCISTQRIYVHSAVWELFLPKLLAAFAQLKSGNPAEKDTVNGPLIDAIHLERIRLWVEKAVSSGAKILYGGEILDKGKNLYSPTLLSDVPYTARIYAEEAFGPVAIIEPVKDFKSGIARINDSVFGLQSGIFTQNIQHMKYALEHLEVGGIIVNQVPGFRIDTMPYGGVKDSGFGREGVRFAMEEMTEKRLLVF
ncbi:MAG: aldehyde dehydrogenase family protein [Bacteroidia bacterium]|nr:aldehyde dehydrogenase family protein [Bacteroidia bacterium]